jgi:type I restriction enzyme M protein
MTDHSQQIVQKLWNFCNVLRDDGMSYGDYVEQFDVFAVPQDGRRG